MASATMSKENGGTMTDPFAMKRARFAEIARLHQPLLFRVAMNLTHGNETFAADLVQDALVNGYKAFLAGTIDESANIKAWLIRTVTNGFLHENRRKRTNDTAIEDDAQYADETMRPDTLIAEALLDGPLEAAVSELPEHHKLCVVLVDIEGLDYAEAASILQVPIGTVRSRLARARLALHDKLVEYGRSKGY